MLFAESLIYFTQHKYLVQVDVELNEILTNINYSDDIFVYVNTTIRRQLMHMVKDKDLIRCKYYDDELWITSAVSYANSNHILDMIEMSCSRGYINALKMLMSRYELSTQDTENIFYTSCCCGQLEVVKYLFEANRSLSIDSAFEVACKNNHVNIAKYLLNARIWSIEELSNGFQNSVECRNIPIVKYIVEEYITDENTRLEVISCGDGIVFYIAWGNGDKELIEYLQSKANVNHCSACQ